MKPKLVKVNGKEFAVCMPQVRTVKFNIFDVKLQKPVDKIFTLAFPYTVYWVNEEEYDDAHRVAFAKDNTFKELYPMPLHNSNKDFYVCGLESSDPLALAEEFWQTKFVVGDSDYDGAYYLSKSTMKNYKTWEKLTKVDPKFIMHPNCNFGSVPVPIKKAMDGEYYANETAADRQKEDFTNYF
jgi:hypothetical protein